MRYFTNQEICWILIHGFIKKNNTKCMYSLVWHFLMLQVHKLVLTPKFKKTAIKTYSDCWQFLRETCKDQYCRFWCEEEFCKEIVSTFKHPLHGQWQNKNRNCLWHALKLRKFLKGSVHLKQSKTKTLSNWFLLQKKKKKNYIFGFFCTRCYSVVEYQTVKINLVIHSQELLKWSGTVLVINS